MSEIRMSKRDSAQALVIITIPALMCVLALMLTSALLTLMFSLVISSRLGDMMARPNPLSGYEIIWPGGTLDDVVEYVRQRPKGQIVCYSNAPLAYAHSGLPLAIFSSVEMF